MRILELPQRWSERAMIVTEVDDPASWLSADELQVVAAFRHEKRRREWMLSRIAEKELRRRSARGECVSYSHSGAFGASAIGEEPVGIDVEVIRAISPGAVHLFLTEDEAAAATACTLENALLHFWSAKEAKWKQLGGAVPTLKRVPLLLTHEGNSGLTFEGVETCAGPGIVVALTS